MGALALLALGEPEQAGRLAERAGGGGGAAAQRRHRLPRRRAARRAAGAPGPRRALLGGVERPVGRRVAGTRHGRLRPRVGARRSATGRCAALGGTVPSDDPIGGRAACPRRRRAGPAWEPRQGLLGHLRADAGPEPPPARAGAGARAGGRVPRWWRRTPTAIRARVEVPVAAVRRTAGDPRLVRLQVAWAAVMVASWTATVSLSVVAFAEGGSAAVALAVLARTVPGVVVGPVVGALVDRFPRRRCLVAAALLCGLASRRRPCRWPTPRRRHRPVTVVALVTMLFRTAQSAVLPELVDDPAELTAANVVSSAVESVGLFAGPALAAGLLALQGPELAFGAAAVLFAVAGLLVLRLPAPDGADGRRGRAGGRTRDLLRLRAARLVLALLLAQTVLSGGLVVLYPALAVEALDLDVSAVGLLTAAFGLGRRRRVARAVRPGRVPAARRAERGRAAAVVAAVAPAAAGAGARPPSWCCSPSSAAATCCSTSRA